MRQTLFISHSSPEDNLFVRWLSSRLQLMGYKTWCDLERFKGGERDFWGRLETAIRDDSCKFLLVVSRHSMMSDGVLKEFHFAEQVAKEMNIKDFVFPMWLEKVPYTIRIGLSIYNKFNFETNWAKGLQHLIEKLAEDGVQRQEAIINNTFLDSVRLPIDYQVTKKKERYYTNWWPIEELPETIFYFQFEKEIQAKAIFKEFRKYPLHRHGNILLTFQSSIPTSVSKGNPERDFFEDGSQIDIAVSPIRTGRISISEIMNESYESDLLSARDGENILKRLLWKGFALLMRSKRLSQYQMSNKSVCFYYPTGVVNKNKTTIHYRKYKKSKNLVGKHIDSIWHFGVSCKVQLSPLPSFVLKSHIVFSYDGIKIWEEAGKLHTARRKKGKTWFNEHWRDQLMAFLNTMSNDSEEVRMDLSDEFIIHLPLLTKSYLADFGYHEPKTNDRQDTLADQDDDEEGDSSLSDITEAKNED